MDFHVHLESDGDLARQIYRQFRDAILSGALRAGDRVPPTRELARRLDVSRNTVGLAYEWLVAGGFLTGRKGAGTFVQPQQAGRPIRKRAARTIHHRAVWDRIEARLPPPAPPFDFGVGKPDAQLFPFAIWRRLLARQIRPSNLTSDYGDPSGHPRLRAAIARYVAVNRGVNATVDDVIVTNGAQQAFDLIARVLVEPGDTVAVEEPGYPPPRLLFQSVGARVTHVRVDSSGLDVTALPDHARIVYVTPSHQFPMGMPMPHVRRMALLEWAERRNAVIIEDDYDSEFRFAGRPIETLQSLDRSGRVIYAGSFSKSLLPALRIGFVIAPPSLTSALRAAGYVSNWFSQWPAQAALASLIDSGLLARHVGRMRRVYAERHDRILGTLVRDFAKFLEPIPSVTGMHLAARLRSGRISDERAIAERAWARGVGFDRLSVYYAGDRPQAGLVLGYGGIASERIDEALRRLRSVFR
jgi:GntR family transcriptional regulator / MocR family aminotransferase